MRREGKGEARGGATAKSCGSAFPSRARDGKYLAWIRTRPCLVCGRVPSEAHHETEPGHGAMGLKASDFRAVPLCGGPQGHHTGRGTAGHPGSRHASTAFWDRSGICVEAEIAKLNAEFFGLAGDEA